MLWTLGVIAAFAVLAAIGLQLAIARNGPAVLNTVDRITGGTGGAELKASIALGEHPQQKLLIWGPQSIDAKGAPRPVLLFVHGGSWDSGDPDDYGFVGRAFVEAGFVVALGGYRLGEAGKYPGMIEDVAAAISTVRQEVVQYGGNPQAIVIAGHSAGAYNVMMTALQDRWLAKYGLSPMDIAGVVGLSGPYDFLPLKSESTIAAFGHASDLPATQPINWVSEKAPPMLLIHGGKDTTVGDFHSKRMVKKIRAQKLEASGASPQLLLYPEMDHNAPLISIAAPWRSRRDIVSQITDFVHEQSEAR